MKTKSRLFLALLWCFFFNTTFAQVVRTVDNKGTIKEVRNNQVTTAAIAPITPLENDFWIDTVSNTVKVWEGTPLNAWQEIASIRNWINNTNSGTYAINHLVSYNGNIYKNITGTNLDTTPVIDTTNWTVVSPDFNVVPLWKSDTNGGSYTTDDIINYSGVLYKNLTGVNLETSPDIDTTNWIAIGGGDIIPLWKSSTNGGTYATNDILNYGGALYKNLTSTNLDTTPDIDTTNWIKIIPEVINNLMSTSTTDALSANEGRILNNLIQALDVLPESQRNISYLQASHIVDHVFATANTPEPIPFDTNDEDLGITHSVSVNNSEITIQSSAIYTIVVQPQVYSGTNNGTFRMWLQRDQGAGFVDVPNSNVEIILGNNGEDVLVLTSVGFLAKDDKIRIMGNVNSTSVILDAIYPAGEPVVPAVIIAMYANSTGVNIQKEVNDIVDASIAPPTTNVDDLFALTNVGAIDASWGSIANLEEGDVVVYSGTDWQIVLDVSTQFTKGEYQVYNGADNKVYYFDGLVWKQIADGADEPWFGTDDDAAATTNTEAIYIQAPWVGIGQTRPSTTGGPGGTGNGERLWVDGSIRTTNSIYADYVLEHYVDGTSKSNPEYVPTSLEEADAYIKANKHLPGVTGVDELIKTEKGYNFNITELSVQSLEKIEELYLHTIEQQKRIEALQVQMQAMQVQIQALLTKEK